MTTLPARRTGYHDRPEVLEIPLTEQSLPNNIEVEAAVLGAVLTDPESLEHCEGLLDPGDFFRASHGLLWSVILEMRKSGAKVDVISVADELTRRGQFEELGGDEKLVWLTERGQPMNIDYHAKVMRNLARLRECITIGQELASEAQARSLPSDDLISRTEDRLRELTMDQRGGGTISAGELLPRVLERIERKARGEQVGVRTPWWELNSLVSGFEPGDLIVLGGRTSMGKSAMAVNILESLSVSSPQPQPTVFVSLEMSNESVVFRMIASQGAVNGHYLRMGARMSPEELANFQEANRRILASRFQFVKLPKNQIVRLIPDIRAACRQHKPVLLAIDHVQMIHGDSELTTTAEKIGDICVRLKCLAREQNVPILLLSQINRAAVATAESRPTLQTLKASGGIEENADIVILLHRTKEKPDVAEVEVAKHRNGPVGTFNLKFNYQVSLFEDMPVTVGAGEVVF